MSQNAPSGNLQTALSHAARLIHHKPELALEQAKEILRVVPGTPGALLISAAAHRHLGQTDEALTILEPLSKQLAVPPIFQELGMVYWVVGRVDEAIAALKKSIEIDPKFTDALRTLAELYGSMGMEEQSNKTYQLLAQSSAQHPDVVKAATLMFDGKIKEAESIMRDYLKRSPMDVSAIRILADIGLKLGKYADTQNLLERCLEIAPDYHLARHNYVMVLSRRQRLKEAKEQVEILLKSDSENPNYLILRCTILIQLGEHDKAIEFFEDIIGKYPNQAQAHLNYAHALKTIGRLDDAIVAYRKSVELRPSAGEAYWSLANLKVFRFTDQDIDNMLENVTPEGGGDQDDQAHLAFALGKAYEDRKQYDDSFKFYKRGNAIRRIKHSYDPDRQMYDSVRQIKALTKDVFDRNIGSGSQAKDPIFVLGLPRAGSTLIEQILASHSQVEGTSELLDIIAMSRKLGDKAVDNPASKYPEILTELSQGKLKELGEGYLETTRIHRSDTPYFIDKMPNNFLHIGLIHLILPNAKIIDARRHPMAGCFAGFKQLFARGQTFTYGLEDIGTYYRNYVKVMDHWDEVLPGRVHRVQYEDMVGDTENQIRQLLDYCELPFEDNCLKFYETKRAVRTPSSEQVRQPIYKGALELWREYEAHLDPLKAALGPVLDRYPID